MGQFILTIDTGNAAFEDNGISTEIATILADVTQRIRNVGIDYNDPRPVRDSNGNTVGSFVLRRDATLTDVLDYASR